METRSIIHRWVLLGVAFLVVVTRVAAQEPPDHYDHTASPQKVGTALFATARDPKRYVLIKASNHRFSGAREEFYAALGDAVTWMRSHG